MVAMNFLDNIPTTRNKRRLWILFGIINDDNE